MLLLFVNHTLSLLVVDFPNSPLTHFSAAVTKLLRAFVLTLDCVLEMGIVVLVRELVTKFLNACLRTS
jgi:hypothetical protein